MDLILRKTAQRFMADNEVIYERITYRWGDVHWKKYASSISSMIPIAVGTPEFVELEAAYQKLLQPKEV